MKKLLGLLLFLSLSLSFLTNQVIAKTLTSEDTVRVEKDEVIDDDLFVGGGNVIIEGTVKGDVYVGTGSLIVTGTIEGDLLAAGGSLQITGTIGQDARLAGGNIMLSKAKIGKSLTTFGGNVTIDSETTVGGGFVFGGGYISSEAKVNRGVMGGAGAMNLGGSVGKNVEVGTSSLIIKDKTQIGGDLTYYSDNEAQVSQGAAITGKTYRMDPVEKYQIERDNATQIWQGIKTGFSVWGFLSAGLIGLILIRLFRTSIEEVSGEIYRHPWKSIGLGFAIFFLTPILIIFLFISLIGIPLGVILGGLFSLEMYLAQIIIGVLLGNWLFETLGRPTSNLYLKFLIGLAIYILLSNLPYIGFFVSSATVFFALGSIFTFKRNRLFPNV